MKRDGDGLNFSNYKTGVKKLEVNLFDYASGGSRSPIRKEGGNSEVFEQIKNINYKSITFNKSQSTKKTK